MDSTPLGSSSCTHSLCVFCPFLTLAFRCHLKGSRRKKKFKKPWKRTTQQQQMRCQLILKRLQSWLNLESQVSLPIALRLVAITPFSVVAQRRLNHPRLQSRCEQRARQPHAASVGSLKERGRQGAPAGPGAMTTRARPMPAPHLQPASLVRRAAGQSPYRPCKAKCGSARNASACWKTTRAPAAMLLTALPIVWLRRTPAWTHDSSSSRRRRDHTSTSLRRHSTVAIRPWRSYGLPAKQQWLQQPTPWRVPLAQRQVQEGTQT